MRVQVVDLVAWASELDTPPDRFTRADLLEHHAIISRLHTRMDACLPARFPTWLTDEGAEIRKRASELDVALERVRDRAELAITAILTKSIRWVAASGFPHASHTIPGTLAISASSRSRLRWISSACCRPLASARRRRSPCPRRCWYREPRPKG